MKPSGKETNKLRLQVFLSRNGVCSRRKALEIIQEGRVTVNWKVVREPSVKVSSEDDVRVRGRPVQEKAYSYIMLNKPQGYVTTKADWFGEKTVIDLLPKTLKHLVPVGRLDKDTEGLLLLTNDGDTAYRLTHPKFDINKTYFVRILGKLDEGQKKILEGGIVLDHKKTSPARIEQIRILKDLTEFQISIHEGRNRQIRRMLAEAGHKVVYLKRVSQGPLKLGDLKTGLSRELNKEEIAALQKLKI